VSKLGDTLRERRIALGLSVDQVEHATRIRGKLLEALEEGHYDRLPNPGYVRGYISSYGRFLELDTVPLLNMYKAETGAEDPRQAQHLAGLEVDPVVAAVPGDVDGLRWRTRMRYAVTPEGGRGMRAHRSQRVVPVAECLIALPDARETGPGAAAGFGTGPMTEEVVTAHGTQVFQIAPEGFWQVHPGAPAVLVEAVLGLLQPQPGERALDLYSGVGLFARFLADAVGPRGRVVAVEGDRTAAQLARLNLAGARQASVTAGHVGQVLASSLDEPFDLVVLDPPREGAKRAVVEQVADRAPRAVAYVACDPAALARDVQIFGEHGYRLGQLRAFDLFPMTSHVECVAHLVKSDSGLR